MAIHRDKAQPKASATLKGWAQIAAYLGQPATTVQRWAKSGMPMRKSGRFIVSEPEELNQWLGRESGLKQPAHVSHGGEPDLTADLKAGLKAARNERTRASRKG